MSDEAWVCWCRNDPWSHPCMVNYGLECDRCERPREDGAPYKRWPDRYECKPGWEYTAPMMRAREAALAEEWESERLAPQTAEEVAQAAAWRDVINATCKEVFGNLERAIPVWETWRKGGPRTITIGPSLHGTIDGLRASVAASGYHSGVSNAERNRAKAARRKARGK